MTLQTHGVGPPLPRWAANAVIGLTCWMMLACVSTADDRNQRRVHTGRHLTLSTDLGLEAIGDEQLADMVHWFDAAVPQWISFWNLPEGRADQWHVDGFLMRDTGSFRSRGELPSRIPTIKYGFASRDRIWIRHQPSLYYDRHLLLHEGIHALAIELFGGCGPSWYMEGTAELLATHRQPEPSSGRPLVRSLLTQPAESFRVNQIPRTKSESPHWGRFQVIESHRTRGTLPTLRSVLALPTDLAGSVDSYTWAWALAMLCTAYPETRELYIDAAQRGRDQSDSFTHRFVSQIRRQAPIMEARWRLMMHDLEYGFEWDEHRVELSTSDDPYGGSEMELLVDAGRSWQSTGVWFPAGTTLRVRAGGECVIARQATGIQQDWISRPPGISAVFHRGRPIGQLSMCVLPIQNEPADSLRALSVVPVVDASSSLIVDSSERLPYRSETVTVSLPSWILFRIEDVPGTLGRHHRADNEGHYVVSISPIQDQR
ncbi:MAG: hypothetical protein AAGJ40_06795 [Planctomycetota bacterium]